MVHGPHGACARIPASEFENHVKEFHQTNTLNEVILPKPASSVQKVDPIEVENGDSIPTVHLMDKLKEKHKDTHEFSFIMGSDLVRGLHFWDDG